MMHLRCRLIEKRLTRICRVGYKVSIYQLTFPCVSRGGTLDVTVHEIQDDGNNKKIHKVTGGPYGGIYVNRQFETLLEELFGVQRIQKFKEHPSDWMSLMNEFEGKNRGKRI